MFKLLISLCAMFIIGCGPTSGTSTQPPNPPPGPPPSPPPPQQATEISFHNGTILHSPNVQAVFWGSSWGSSTDKMPGAEQFLNALGGSDYLGIASQYLDNNGPATGELYYSGHTMMDGTSYSLTPDGSNSQAFYNALCSSLSYVPDSNTIYVVFADTPPGVDSNGKMTDCAWHSSFYCYRNGGPKHWATVSYIPNLDGISSCNPRDASTGHSSGLAAIANVTAHEIIETITNPYGTGWYDSEDSEICKSGTNCEIADKCAWIFGDNTQLLDGSEWKLQLEWSNKAYEANSGIPNRLGQYGCTSK